LEFEKKKKINKNHMWVGESGCQQLIRKKIKRGVEDNPYKNQNVIFKKKNQKRSGR
jgi:hypothetical protein